MNKTAMQELIEMLRYMRDHMPKGGLAYDSYDIAIRRATSKLPAERQQIERAYLDGHENGVTQNKVVPPSDYFTATYKTS